MTIEKNAGELEAPSHASESHDSARRSFLRGSASAAILAGFAARLQAQSTGTPPPAPAAWTPDQELRFLVDRISNGWNPEIYQRAVLLGYDAFLEEQLAHTTIADPIVSPMLPQFPTIFKTSKQLYDEHFVVGDINTVTLQLRSATMVRAIYSKRQ